MTDLKLVGVYRRERPSSVTPGRWTAEHDVVLRLATPGGRIREIEITVEQALRLASQAIECAQQQIKVKR